MKTMLRLFVALTLLLTAAPAFAQLPTGVTGGLMNVYSASATNPATDTPVAVGITYATSAFTCGVTKVTVSGTPSNPTEMRLDDPADNTKDCTANIAPQVTALLYGTGYKAALRFVTATVQGPWSNFSNPFDRNLPAPTGIRVR